MKNENIVFCMNIGDSDEPQNDYFRHEADIMAAAVAGEVESGKLTPAEARKLLEPYRDVLPPLFSGEQEMVFDPERNGWSNSNTFPKAEEILRSPQASQIFWYEADELGIEGVELFWSTPFPLLDFVSEDALDELREVMKGRYEIIVKDEIHDTSEFMEECLEWARKQLADAMDAKDSQKIESASGTAGVSSEERVRRLLDDPDFEVGKYIDDDIRDLQAGDLVRICMIDEDNDSHDMDMVNAVGEFLESTGNTCKIEVFGKPRVFERGAIELMPTGFNPHYGGER